MRIHIYPRVEGKTQVLLLPAASKHKRPVMLEGLTDDTFKEAVKEAISAMLGEKPPTPGGLG